MRIIYIFLLLIKYSILYLLSPKKRRILLKNFFEEAEGSFIKFGQLLALRVDFLSKEQCLELVDLFDNVSPFSYKEVERMFLEDLGAMPDRIFKVFEKQPFASGSFGQVHAAKLSDGSTVIVKLQRPGIIEKVKADFFIIDILSSIADIFFKIDALPWKEFAKEFKMWTKKELDYHIEAAHAQKIFNNLKDNEHVVIPKTYHRLSTKKILVQEYIDGIALSRILKETKTGKLNKKKLLDMGINISKMIQLIASELMRQYFIDDFFHADPHPGNILLLDNDKIALIDFGIVGTAAPKKQEFIRSLDAVVNNEFKKGSYFFLKFSGDNLERMIVSALPANIAEKDIDKIIDIFAQHLAESIRKIETRIRKDLKDMKIDYTVMLLEILKLGRRYKIKFPNEMVVFIRALSIIGLLAKEMDYEFNLTSAVTDFLKKHKEEMFNNKKHGDVPYKRMGRERALEQLNNWLAYLIEIDPKLYELVNTSISQYNFVST